MKPAPVVVQTQCSICGLDWNRHLSRGEDPTLETCVKLLKAEVETLRQRPVYSGFNGSGFTLPYNVVNAVAGGSI